MLRPGWFPEYSPHDQKVFDGVVSLIQSTFQQHNFDHIRTPAVERNEVLLKWWEEVGNEIFGLIGLKDYEKGNYERAKKSYSLHFDLTIPLARYTLDHIAELTFPFKRYQIQPVWRGERQQRWRFREFWQCDVDSIWRSGSQDASYAGAETISVLQKSIQAVFDTYDISHNFQSHVSHIGLTKNYLADKLWEDKVADILKLLDSYHKLESEKFANQLEDLIEDEKVIEEIMRLINNQELDLLASYDGYEELTKTLEYLKKLGANTIFDFSIVRGLDYYTGPVFETFVLQEKSLWSICSGWSYEKFTAFLDEKNNFSGVGGSIGLSRMMEIVLDSMSEKITTRSESYCFVYFEETIDEIIALYKGLLEIWKSCEIYPQAESFGKQLSYADKKWCRYAVILWERELKKGIYQIKDLETGETQEKQL